MRSARRLAAALALCAAAAAGCGLGPGQDEGDVSLTVTRDYGSKVLLQKTDSINESDTVLRVLDRNAEVTTRYGGGLRPVDRRARGQPERRAAAATGSSTSTGSSRRSAPPSTTSPDGDRIWWDYRDWTAAMRVPAVVGSWPEPFVHGFQGTRWPAAVDCRAADGALSNGVPALSPRPAL